MNHQKQLIVELEHDALADPANGANRSSKDRVERRIVRAQDEWTGQLDALKLSIDDAAG
jgi:hypothetical protein